jgi:hypothetical protein
MNTENFEAFNRISLHILVTLFEDFPKYVDLDPHTIASEAAPTNSTEANQPIWKSYEIGNATITWLRDEDFISVGNVNDDNYKARLSLKGLTLLGYKGQLAQLHLPIKVLRRMQRTS